MNKLNTILLIFLLTAFSCQEQHEGFDPIVEISPNTLPEQLNSYSSGCNPCQLADPLSYQVSDWYYSRFISYYTLYNNEYGIWHHIDFLNGEPILFKDQSIWSNIPTFEFQKFSWRKYQTDVYRIDYSYTVKVMKALDVASPGFVVINSSDTTYIVPNTNYDNFWPDWDDYSNFWSGEQNPTSANGLVTETRYVTLFITSDGVYSHDTPNGTPIGAH